MRFAVRAGKLQWHHKVDKHNRLKHRTTTVTRYSIDRYDYAVIYWESTKADPVIVSTHADKAAASQALERELVERS